MPKLFDCLHEQLLRAGVTPRYVKRFVLELTQHFEDSRDELEQAGYDRWQAQIMAMNRLGRMEDLAQSMISQQRLRSWTSRAPFATLVLGSLFALISGTAAAILLVIFSIQSISPEWIPEITSSINIFCNVLLPLSCAGAVAVIAIRQRLDRFWPIVGLVVLALANNLIQVAVAMTDGHGTLSVGAGASASTLVSLTQTLALTVIPYLLINKWVEASGNSVGDYR
ncbi:hypothetical protein WKW50_24635 [Ochrobactrum sp. GPK 3]|uniref:hypothetical protein n=1 Tax=Brucella sp. 22210 TaxID=3453892 RepID=UPI0031384ADF